MGSVTMAVKLILVSLVVLSISLAWAQQSEETGGSDRRTSLRRFSSRKKVENTRNAGRVKASADILEKRKQLFQRNPTRRRNFGKVESRDKNEERGESLRVRTTTTTEAYAEAKEDEIKPQFKGVSEVRTVSSPSGFRSSNEQIVRVSFKKTTTQPTQTTDKEIPTTQKPRRNQLVKVTGRRRLGIRRKGQNSRNNSQRVTVAPVKDRNFQDNGSSNPLNNLLKIASENDATEESLEPVDMEAAIKEMKDDNMIEKPSDIEAAIQEMKEDNRIIKPKTRLRGNSPRRLAGSGRVNGRGRNGQRQPAQRVTGRKESKPNFRSFPARQNAGRVSQVKTTTARPTPRQRFEARPTVSPTQQDFAPTQLFQGFDFPTPGTPASQPNQFNIVTEAPRSAFQLDQNFRRNNQNVIADQQIIAVAEPIQVSQQFIQTPQVSQASAPLQPQTAPLTPQVPVPRQQFQTNPQQVLPQNSFNLLNTNNFQAFDAQFGGSVPTNPGASQLASSIFAQPQTALLQGRDVLVNPQNGFQATPLQPRQVFQQQAAPQLVFQQQGAPQQVFQQAGRSIQQAAPQFSNQNIQPASFSGHPASDINLQTGSFNLRTG